MKVINALMLLALLSTMNVAYAKDDTHVGQHLAFCNQLKKMVWVKDDPHARVVAKADAVFGKRVPFDQGTANAVGERKKD